VITIGSTKKTLLFNVSTEGIKEGDLEFWFRVIMEDVSYGLKGEVQEDGRVRVTIPPVGDLLVNADKTKECTVKLEAVGEEKYYIKAWEDKGLVKIEPKAVAELDSTPLNEEESEPAVSASMSEELEEKEVTEDVEEIEVVSRKSGSAVDSLLDQVLKK